MDEGKRQMKNRTTEEHFKNAIFYSIFIFSRKLLSAYKVQFWKNKTYTSLHLSQLFQTEIMKTGFCSCLVCYWNSLRRSWLLSQSSVKTAAHLSWEIGFCKSRKDKPLPLGCPGIYLPSWKSKQPEPTCGARDWCCSFNVWSSYPGYGKSWSECLSKPQGAQIYTSLFLREVCVYLCWNVLWRIRRLTVV